MISYQEGVVDDGIRNPTVSLRLTFILQLIECHRELIDAGVPTPDWYEPEDVYYEVDDERGRRMIIGEKQLNWKDGYGTEDLEYCEIEEICEGNPEEVGRIYLIDTADLLNAKYKYLADFLTGEDSPYRCEYENLKALYNDRFSSIQSNTRCGLQS